MSNMRKAEDILTYFKNWNFGEEHKMYFQYHCRRYEFLLRKIDKIIGEIKDTLRNESLKILDIGPSFQTEILRKTLPEAIVNTLGIKASRFKPRPQDRHFQFNLNDAQYQERWPKTEKHDLVILAEVIEHLYTSPVLVFKCISTWLKSGRYLFIQTPNACALSKRLKMFIGKNPYEMIRETRSNPGHFREYTVGELISIGNQSGFTLVEHTICNYFTNGTIEYKLYNILCSILPSEFRNGITICFKKI